MSTVRQSLEPPSSGDPTRPPLPPLLPRPPLPVPTPVLPQPPSPVPPPVLPEISMECILTPRQLIWHVCQLCNTVTCGLSAYLSLECLIRDLVNSGLSGATYMPAITGQGAMLHEMSAHLSSAVEALMQKPQHVECLQNPSYRTLLRAAMLLPRTVNWIPSPVYKRLPLANEVYQLRNGTGEAAMLMDGDPGAGIEGWKGCWEDGKYLEKWT